MKFPYKNLLLTSLLLSTALTSQAMALTPLPARKLIKDVSYIKQKGAYCAPASAAMLLKYYGADATQDKLANLASEQTLAHKGTPLDKLCEAIRKMGYEASLMYLNDPKIRSSLPASQEHFLKKTMPIIQNRIAMDKPVLYTLAKPNWPNTHLVIIIGYDSKKQLIYFLDPAAKSSKIRNLSYKKFSIFGNIPAKGNYYQIAVFVEPTSNKRHLKNNKDKDFSIAKSSDKSIDYLKKALLDLNRRSIDAKVPPFEMLPQRGFITDKITKFDFEKIDLLREDLRTSREKAKAFGEKHSLPAIEANISNKKIVTLVYRDKKTKQFDFLIMTGYNKDSRKFNVLQPKDDLKSYKKTGMTYKQISNRLNMQISVKDRKGKTHKFYTHRVIVFTRTK